MNAKCLRPTLKFPLVICALAVSAIVGGCGSAASRHHYGTYSVTGIVVSYPATLTRTVTLADLTPVGAGVPIEIAEQAGLNGHTSSYYHTHKLPVTDANGRFTIQVDDAYYVDFDGFNGAVNPLAEIIVTNQCSTAALALKSNGKITGYSETLGGSTLTHGPHQQLEDAGHLAVGQFGTDVVIVVTDNTDACTNPVVNVSY